MKSINENIKILDNIIDVRKTLYNQLDNNVNSLL